MRLTPLSSSTAQAPKHETKLRESVSYDTAASVMLNSAGQTFNGDVAFPPPVESEMLVEFEVRLWKIAISYSIQPATTDGWLRNGL